MSNDKQNRGGEGGEHAEIAALRQQLADQTAAMGEMQRQIQALAGQRNFQGDQQVVINMPNGMKESQAIFERLSAKLDAGIVDAEERLKEGPRHFRICIRDMQNLKRLETMEKDRRGNPVHPSEWNFNPFNPWRIVGGRDEMEARAKYNAHFGIRGISDGAEYVVYECDAEGQPLEAVAA